MIRRDVLAENLRVEPETLCYHGGLSTVVATRGRGTGLPTQRECLEIMDCYGTGKVKKFAEILAAVSLAGDISLAAAICASDWVSSHEKYGRNR